MQQVLIHPDFRSSAPFRIEADAVRSPVGGMELRFLLTGSVTDLVVPPPAEIGRADGLWRHTCFEAFVGTANGDGYVELNFAPSAEWAAYAFDGYRQGMRPAEVPPPLIEAMAVREGLELTATVDLSATGLPLDAPWRVGLSAVIEARGGEISYWALAHPSGKPDFHHRDGFVIELPTP